MLGRTANDLFWLSRYVERAENIARLVEVNYRIGLMPHDGAGKYDEWRSALVSSGNEEGYRAKYPELDAATVIDYLLLDPDNPSSVYSCLAQARENGRSQRTALTQEMWESLNTTWLEIARMRRTALAVGDLMDLLKWIKDRSALFRGALTGTHLRNDTYLFSQLGAFVERADNTARILDVKYYVLLPELDMIGGSVDTRQWNVILRSVSAHRSYRWEYREAYRPRRVAEFLILNAHMPRSLAFSYDEIGAALADLARLYGARSPAHEIAAATAALLNKRDIDAIMRTGLHEFLIDFRARNGQLAIQIARDYHFDD